MLGVSGEIGSSSKSIYSTQSKLSQYTISKLFLTRTFVERCLAQGLVEHCVFKFRDVELLVKAKFLPSNKIEQ